jgi:hypothetical protein
VAEGPKLLSGDNPQIPLGYGDEPVQRWIAAVPGWKQAVCRRLDGARHRTGPRCAHGGEVELAPVRDEEGRWFLSLHCYARYVKAIFFRGGDLDPLPPGRSKYEAVRHLDVRESDEVGAQFIAWVQRASELPGEKM